MEAREDPKQPVKKDNEDELMFLFALLLGIRFVFGLEMKATSSL